MKFLKLKKLVGRANAIRVFNRRKEYGLKVLNLHITSFPDPEQIVFISPVDVVVDVDEEVSSVSRSENLAAPTPKTAFDSFNLICIIPDWQVSTETPKTQEFELLSHFSSFFWPASEFEGEDKESKRSFVADDNLAISDEEDEANIQVPDEELGQTKTKLKNGSLAKEDNIALRKELAQVISLPFIECYKISTHNISNFTWVLAL
jgi:hypothetical protein